MKGGLGRYGSRVVVAVAFRLPLPAVVGEGEEQRKKEMEVGQLAFELNDISSF